MRLFTPCLVITMAVLVPNVGNAQVNKVGTPPPVVTAAGAEWQTSGSPVLFNGEAYYPAGPTVFFDTNVMARIGTFNGVPIYADATLEPNSIVYVPIGGGQLRPYERKREGELAGTTGSRAPEFPVGTAGTTETTPAPAIETETLVTPTRATTTIAARPRRGVMESVPRPSSNGGIWIEYKGARWYNAGTAVPYSPDRFVPAGEYHGFPVFVQKDDTTGRIYVAAVRDGPLVPYKK